MNYNAERWLIEWYDMDWDPHYPYKQEVYYFSPYAYWIAAGIYPQVWVENVYGDTVKQPTEVTFYPGKWRGVIKTYYHTQDTFPEIPLDTNFVLVDDIVPEVRIVEIGDQGDTPAKDNITFLVAGEETVKVMVYENCYADVKLYISFQDSLPVKGSIDTINLGSIGKLLKEQMLKAAYYFGFMKGREFTLQLKVEDSWGNSFLSECEKADIGPVKVTVFNERDTVWPLYTGNGEGPYSTYIFVNAIRTWNGKAVRDLPLTFSLSRVVGSGGHHHGDSTELHGTLYYNGTVLQDADTLKTTEDGLILNYCSSVVGQQEVVRVRTREDYYVVYPPLDNESIYCDDTLYILVPGLVHYPDFAPVCVAFKPQPEEHPDPFYIDSTKVNVMNAFFDTLRNFLDENYGDASEYPIMITDISLEYGGLYDINANWAPPHHTHREGKDIDIRCEWYYEDESKRLGLPVVWGITEEGKRCAKVPKLLEENVFKRWHVDAGIHNPTSKYAHYHLDIDYASFPQQQ